MNWFRSNIQPWTWSALFALTLQIAVSFGHVDIHDLGLASLIEAAQTYTSADKTGAPVGPAAHDRRPAPDHYCPICASIALIGTGAPSLLPVLIVPGSFVRFSPPVNRTYGLRPQFTLSFQARGPPTV